MKIGRERGREEEGERMAHLMFARYQSIGPQPLLALYLNKM